MRRVFGLLLFGPALVACGGASAEGSSDAGHDSGIVHDAQVARADTSARPDAPPSHDAGVDAHVFADAAPDVTEVSDGPMPSDAREAMAPVPVGTPLVMGSRFAVEGVTDDGHVIYATPSSIQAVPAAGGASIALGDFGFDDAGALGNGAVVIAHNLVFLWTNVTQLEASALPVGTLSVWSSTRGTAPTTLSTAALAPGPYGGVVVAASPDGASFAYLVASTPSGDIASLVGAHTSAPTMGTTIEVSLGGSPVGLCGPGLSFSGAVFFAHYCTVTAGDEAAPALFAFDTSTWAKSTLLGSAVVSTFDGTGAYAAAIAVGGELDLLATGSDAAAPVSVDPSVSLTVNQSIFLSANDHFVLYTTPGGALKRSSVTTVAPTTLVGANAATIDGVSPDESWAYVNGGTDPNTGLPSDLSLAATGTAGPVRSLATDTIATLLGDGFTSDSSYALFGTALSVDPMTGIFAGGTLNAAAVASTNAPTVLSADNTYEVFALTGTRVLFGDHYDPSSGIAGTVTLHTVDVAGGASSQVIAAADVGLALTHDKSKLAYTLNFGANTDGLYIVPVP